MFVAIKFQLFYFYYFLNYVVSKGACELVLRNPMSLSFFRIFMKLLAFSKDSSIHILF